MRGVGMFDAANNTFSGSLNCAPGSVGANCDSNGRIWCGSDASCAWNNAGSYANQYYAVGVATLPITIITTIR